MYWEEILVIFLGKYSNQYSTAFTNIYACRKTQGIQMNIMKRKRWRRSREKIPRRKRTQVLFQGGYYDKVAVQYVLLPLCIPQSFKK
jgi:hypothetical protein